MNKATTPAMTNSSSTSGAMTASLAPMAGYTDTVFRRICSEMGAAYTVSEMISAVALTYNDRKTADLARIEAGEAPCVLQIFGHDPKIMAKAADILLSGNFEGRHYAARPAGIDINMGCPVKKIFTSGDGSALMKNGELVGEITQSVAEVCERYGVPLSVKIRLGVDEDSINAPEIAGIAVKNGAKKITLHTRTRVQMYSPSARPEMCREVREAIEKNGGAILCGNGDIESPEDALKYIENGCDEVAVGRGALGNPWIFKALSSGANEKPTQGEIIDLAVKFVEEVVKLKGEEVGVRESRSRAAYFIRGMRGSAATRDEMNHAVTVSEFVSALKKLTVE